MDVKKARRQIIRNNPHLVTLSDAGVLNFNTDMKSRVKECKVYFSPVQSGSGDPAPDNVRPITGWTGVTGYRAGINMLDVSNTTPGYISEQGVKTYDSAFCYTNPIYLPAGEIFTITGNHPRTIQSWLRVHGYDKNDNWIRQIEGQGAYPSVPYDLSFTMPSDVAYIRISMPVMDDAQLSPGTTPTPYTPYSGTTYPVTFPAVGKNLLDPQYRAKVTNSISYYTQLNPLTLSPGSYVFSCSSSITGLYVKSNGSDIYKANNTSYVAFTLAEQTDVYFSSYQPNISNDLTFQLEKGSTATAYEPFDNTIYGGYVDLVSGVLVATWAKWVENGSRKPSYWPWTQDAENNVYTALFFALPEGLRHSVGVGGITSMMCPNRKTVGINSVSRDTPNTISAYPAPSSYSFCYSFTGAEFATMTKEQLTEYIAENPIEVVYLLSTPITYQFAPQQLSVLRGENNFWSNANGNTDLSFWTHMRERQDGLPLEYQRVEYLESSGTQYIDTGIYPSNTIGFDVTYYTKSSTTSTNKEFGCLFGGREISGSRDFQFTTYTSSPSSLHGSFRFGLTAAENAGIISGTKQSASLRNLLFVNGEGETIQIPSYSNWDQYRKTIYLFMLHDNGGAVQGGSGCRIYSIKFYDDLTLTANFIPCIRKSDSKPGMYDKVSKTFYTNAGTGEFTVPAT